MQDWRVFKISLLIIITQVALNGVGWMKIQYLAAEFQSLFQGWLEKVFTWCQGFY